MSKRLFRVGDLVKYTGKSFPFLRKNQKFTITHVNFCEKCGHQSVSCSLIICNEFEKGLIKCSCCGNVYDTGSDNTVFISTKFIEMSSMSHNDSEVSEVLQTDAERIEAISVNLWLYKNGFNQSFLKMGLSELHLVLLEMENQEYYELCNYVKKRIDFKSTQMIEEQIEKSLNQE